jgi:hypothetical protein
MPDSIPAFKVGDKVLLVKRTHRRYEPEAEIETTVTKVGRKYFTVEHGLHYQKFHLDSGFEVSNYSASCYVTTPERQAEKALVSYLVDALRKQGVTFDGHHRNFTSKSLKAILGAVLAEGGA